ncbi:MAG TPA: tetraacyldisaccharide 4'-kinase [Longimicrobiales bacterium]|nr:tetraacyldisaccharide 4'-kinase [Longimicrobiales bacterium]
MQAARPVTEWPAGRTSRRVFETATQGPYGPVRLLLAPVEQLYSAVMFVRNQGYDHGLLRKRRVAVPVISVGNIVAGGAGKTPVTRWLTEQLLARGRRPAILHGGYGADEPKLHQQWHPDVLVIANRDRVAAAQHAMDGGADVIILDDAFQHRRLARDLDIVLLAAETTNLHLLPRGPGREPLRSLARSNFVLVTRKIASTDRALVLETTVHKVAPGIPTGRVLLKLATPPPTRPVVAVTSIARPDLFLEQLRAQGAQVERMLAYPDHFAYTPADASYIAQRAVDHLLVTTAKDAVKLRELLPDQPLHVMEQEVVFENGAGALLTALDNVL